MYASADGRTRARRASDGLSSSTTSGWKTLAASITIALIAMFVAVPLALLPFEPEAYRRLHGPPCSYVGHPLIEEVSKLRPNGAEAMRRRSNDAPSESVPWVMA